jgi:hypothetical protein
MKNGENQVRQGFSIITTTTTKPFIPSKKKGQNKSEKERENKW